MSLAGWFDDLVAEGLSDRPLAFFEGETVAYGEVRSRAWAIGSALQRLGATGERVVTMLPNDPDLLLVQLAILHAGGIAVPLMAEGTADEMRYFVDDSKPRVVIATPERWAQVAPLVHAAPQTVVLTHAPEPPANTGYAVHGFAQLETQGAELGLDPVAVADTEPMALMYTSGSTARPKGVMVDAASFIKDAQVQPDLFGLREGESVLGVLPLYHIAGWHQSLAIALGCRGGLMMQRRFSASRFWLDVEQSRAVAGLLMPAMVAILLARREQRDDADHPLRVVITHWPIEAFERRFAVEMVPVWGQTELGGLATAGRVGDLERLSGCVGRPVPGTEIEIRDETGRPLPVGDVGEVYVRSPWVMKGYWADPALTASVLQNGWVRTGDLGSMDHEGRLFYSGRLKGMIKRGGENISAREVETVLEAHPDVAECACFGVSDPIRTEEVKVVLVLRAGASVPLSDLVEFTRIRLAEFKVPRYWEIREDLPRTRSMKVAIDALRAAHAENRCWDRTATR